MATKAPGKFLTSSITGSAGAVAKGAITGQFSGGFEGAWLGASMGSFIPGGTLPGAAIGASLGAAFGGLLKTSKVLNVQWEQLIVVTRSLVSTFAKFDPLIAAQQEKWRRLDQQINKAWAKAIAPTLKRLTDIGVAITRRWTRLKISVFKSWEGVVNKLIDALGALMHIVLSLAEFLEKLKNLFKELFSLFAPFIVTIKLLMDGVKGLAKLLGITVSSGATGFKGAPSWAPGPAPGYSDKSAGGIGGTPLLRGKFKPGMQTPEWARGKKLEFTWMKDLKTWLGGYLDKILTLLNFKEKAFGAAKEIIATTTSAAAPSIAPPVPGLSVINKLITALKVFTLAFRIGTGIGERQRRQDTTQPITEEDIERYRKEHNLPRKPRSEAAAPDGGVFGVAGAISRAVGVSAFTSLPDTPKIHVPKVSDKSKPTPEATLEVEKGRLSWYQEHPEFHSSDDKAKIRKIKKNIQDAELELMQQKESTESEDNTTPDDEASTERTRLADSKGGNVIMQVLDSNQLLDMLSFSWTEIRTVLRHQQAEYTLLKYRMQTEGTYM